MNCMRSLSNYAKLCHYFTIWSGWYAIELGSTVNPSSWTFTTLTKANYDEMIENAISSLDLDNFEELCDYIFSKKNEELKTELDRICMIETICHAV